MKKLNLSLATCAILLFAFSNAGAATVLQWDFFDNYTSDPLVADYIDPSLESGSSLNSITDLYLNQLTNVDHNYAWTAWRINDSFNLYGDYLHFSLSPAEGQSMTLESLEYQIGGTNTAPTNARWGMRVNGGSWVYHNFTLESYDAVLSLTTWDFDDITITASDTVEFRFWVWGTVGIDGGAANTGGQVRFMPGPNGSEDFDLIVNATVIPESSSYALGMAGLLIGMLLLWRVHPRESEAHVN